mgnify:CR=1 FL=1
MKKTIGILVIVYGIGLSSYFGWWALKDNAALEIAVKANAPQKKMRHRINVFAEGVWFLLSNMIALQGVSMALEKEQNSRKERLS